MFVDLILIAFFVVIVLIYMKKGFIKSVWGVVRAVASVAAAWLFGKQVGEWFYNQFIHNAISKATKDAIAPLVQKVNDSFNLSDLFSKIPDEFRTLVERSGADLSGLKSVFGKLTEASENQFDSLADKISEPIAHTVSNAVGYVLVFFIAFILMSIAFVVIDGISKLPLIKEVNKTLGAAFGAVCGIIYLWVICMVLSLFVESSAAGATGELVGSYTASSHLVKFFCSISPFDFINIKKIL